MRQRGKYGPQAVVETATSHAWALCSELPRAVAADLNPRIGRRLRWWWKTRGCECHWQKPYGEVVMLGCPLHD